MVKGFLSGVTAYARAFQIIAEQRLWGYFLAPSIICIVLGILIFGTAWSISGDIGSWMIKLYPFETGRSVLEKIASVFGGLFVVAFGLIIFKQLVLAISSPFMSPLSEKVEQKLTGKTGAIPFSFSRFFRDLIRGLTIALRNIIRELFFTFLLFLLGLIPIFAPFTAILNFIVQAFYAGFGNMDFLLERHYNVRGSVRFAR